MRIRNKLSGGIATVNDEDGARMIAQGGWVDATITPRKPKRKRARKAEPVVAPEPQTEPTPAEVPDTKE
ncbi:head-tail connector protein [Mycobacterium phage Kimona]|uniref:Head-to-tail connector protein n=1 Tax=Mycobacterium phage Kimona TaxID=2024295 RepID=A0A249XTX4_9CAUD|nr:head-tail connector protein [Mycobacterium phage Kimona]ASZ75449.1 hypothetical protein PBI_KIMONA_13 [Mycobacterium phage Kimona]